MVEENNHVVERESGIRKIKDIEYSDLAKRLEYRERIDVVYSMNGMSSGKMYEGEFPMDYVNEGDYVAGLTMMLAMSDRFRKKGKYGESLTLLSNARGFTGEYLSDNKEERTKCLHAINNRNKRLAKTILDKMQGDRIVMVYLDNAYESIRLGKKIEIELMKGGCE